MVTVLAQHTACTVAQLHRTVLCASKNEPHERCDTIYGVPDCVHLDVL